MTTLAVAAMSSGVGATAVTKQEVNGADDERGTASIKHVEVEASGSERREVIDKWVVVGMKERFREGPKISGGLCYLSEHNFKIDGNAPDAWEPHGESPHAKLTSTL
ncbi:hypothetical protein C8R43DRAFT_942640 [Mycena crocata]|nr:hypothetical protein C8R43DRAFT_942640 [Mycena crocata]